MRPERTWNRTASQEPLELFPWYSSKFRENHEIISDFDHVRSHDRPASEHSSRAIAAQPRGPLLPHRHYTAAEKFPAAEAAPDISEDREGGCEWEAYAKRLRGEAGQLGFDKGEGELAYVTGGSVNTCF